MMDFALAAGLAIALLVGLAATGRLRLLLEELPTARRRIAGAALLWGVLTTCVFMPIVAPGAAADVDPDTLWFPSLFAGQFLLALFLVGWWYLAQPLGWRRFLLLEDATANDVAYGTKVGVVAWILAVVAGYVVAGLLHTFGADPDPDAGALRVPPIMRWLVELPVARKLIVVAIAMTIEEAFYRAFLQTRIGWVASSVLFALSHAGYGMPTLMASVFAVSLVIGWALHQRRNLLPCIVAHGVFDAVQLLVVMPFALDHLDRMPLA